MQVSLKNYTPYLNLKEELSRKTPQDKTQKANEENLQELKSAKDDDKKALSKEEKAQASSQGDGGEELVDLYEKLQELLSEIAKLSAKMQNAKDEQTKDLFLKQIMVLNAQAMEVINLIREREAESQTSI
ncbi:hypothetical protein NYG95_04605 [Campylobacter felis]|uniref:Flagella secreted protein n=1 Tax=Campylobacter felis TaxID=2974565 RepID=A0ABT7I5F1_9BACT|nr:MULTISPECIES: hypothetical protein [Campylobacter]MDL0103603.1 hypothetical protein [Campylobacter felis]MDL0108415.1 hypothetical protein [Campylobacter felis]MDL0110309.1 hypothetical protein [Campylobacter felis]MDL0146925.1 hypothetical protein [Campylobacter felis]